MIAIFLIIICVQHPMTVVKPVRKRLHKINLETLQAIGVVVLVPVHFAVSNLSPYFISTKRQNWHQLYVLSILLIEITPFESYQLSGIDFQLAKPVQYIVLCDNLMFGVYGIFYRLTKEWKMQKMNDYSGHFVCPPTKLAKWTSV